MGIIAGGSHRIRLIPARELIRDGRLKLAGRDLRPMASEAVRGAVLIAIALLLIFVLLPAALVAAGT